jgi:hypothetical protein
MNLYSEELLENINFFLEKIKLVRMEYDSDMPEDVECVLHLGKDEEDDTIYECYYYLVDHSNRILFWMNDFTADDMIAEIDGATDPRHISAFFLAIFTWSLRICRVRTREQLLVSV